MVIAVIKEENSPNLLEKIGEKVKDIWQMNDKEALTLSFYPIEK